MSERIIIIGISGTGKSVAGLQLAQRIGLPLYHMDSIIWSPNWVETPHDVVQSRMDEIVAGHAWIIEGWIDVYSMSALERAGKIIYLDYAGWRAAWGGLKRWLTYKGKKRPEMPEGCVTGGELSFIVKMLLRKERPHIEAILKDIPREKIIRVYRRAELKKLFEQLG